MCICQPPRDELTQDLGLGVKVVVTGGGGRNVTGEGL